MVLIISKNNQIEQMFQQTFQNIQLTRISSGRLALEQIPILEPVLILSEFESEDMDARTVFRSLVEDKRFASYSSIPFILFSSESLLRAQFGKELCDLGLSGWYVYPFHLHEFKELIENHLIHHNVFIKNRLLQQEVKKSEFRYRDLLENAVDFIFTLDASGRFLYLNNRFNGLIHHHKENWVGKSFLSLIHSNDQLHARENYHMAQQGKARVFEARLACMDPNGPVLSFSITPVVEHGTIVGSIGIGRDVVEQKKMEQEILDLKNFNESIIESMEAGLLTMDLETRITSLNSGGQKILGWKADEIHGKPIRSVLKPGEVDALLSNPRRPGMPSYSREIQLTLKSGRIVSIGFTVTDRLDNQHRKLGTIISFRDITQLKQMQAEVIRMDRLASLGVLASGIAHEIKNPLAGIKALAQACEEEFDENDSRREYLVRISRQVNRLDELLRTFFSYARPKTPDRKHCAVADILGEVLHLVSKKMQQQQIEFVQELPKNLQPVWVDNQQMQQVFLNLILNAIEAMPDGGILKFNALALSTSAQINFIEVSIHDTGMGIPESQLETIFDPFYSTKPSGLGLGLSIVCRIIDEHRGDIRVKSTEGAGTTFTIKLPTGVNE